MKGKVFIMKKMNETTMRATNGGAVCSKCGKSFSWWDTYISHKYKDHCLAHVNDDIRGLLK